MEHVPITIIGGGVVGTAIAYELSRENEVLLIEKNDNITGENQSSRNSGVIHSGIYYDLETEPLKSKLCVEGNELLYAFAKEHRVTHKNTGKLIVAADEREHEYLEDLVNKADNKNIETELLTYEKVRQYERNVRAYSAIHVPSTGIIEPTELIRKLQSLSSSYFLFGNEVIEITPEKEGFTLDVSSGERILSDIVINSAGLYSDRVARMINSDSEYEIQPIKGEWAKFYQTREELEMNGMAVYPAPQGITKEGDKLNIPFSEYEALMEMGTIDRTLGIHLTPTLENNDLGSTVTMGPTYSSVADRKDYSNKVTRKQYLQEIVTYFPNIQLKDIKLHQAGIRAALKHEKDFVIELDRNYDSFINLVGIDSPGLTSSLAIARYVKELV